MTVRLAPALLLALLAGCAAPPTQQQVAAQASAVSDMDLCQAIITARPEYVVTLQNEANRRRVNCVQMADAVMARIEASRTRQMYQQQIQAQQTLQTLQIMQALNPAPPPIPVPQTTFCQSRWIGGTLRTVCN